MKRQYAGPRARAGVARLVTGTRPSVGGGRASVRGETRVFVPVALTRDGRKALKHLFTSLGLSWDVAESFGDAVPGRVPSADERKAAFASATAFVLRHPTGALADGSDVWVTLKCHRYCHSLSFDVVRPDRGAWDGTRIADKPRTAFKGEPADVREDAKGFASRWERACAWVETLEGFTDDELDTLASVCCDWFASQDDEPADVAELIAWVNG